MDHGVNNLDDMMQFVDMGEDLGSEFELSEDGISSVDSVSEIKFEDLQYSFPQPVNDWVDPTQMAHATSSHHHLDQRSLYGTDIHTEELMDALVFGTGDGNTPAPIPNPETHKTSLEEMQRQISAMELPYQVLLRDFPTRSRVETQIKCRLMIKDQNDGAPASLLQLPSDSVARPRFQLYNANQTIEDPQLASNTLWLAVDVVNPDVPKDQVLMCEKCLARERRRAFRKKTMDMHEETYWNQLEQRRIIIFNCKEVMPITSDGLVELPLRVACYCRHHAAKNGYNVVFTLRNAAGTVVGRCISPNLLITDSHKDHRAPSIASITSSSSSLSGVSPGSDAGLHRASSSSSLMKQHPYMRPQNKLSSQLKSQIQTSQSVPSWVANVQRSDMHAEPPSVALMQQTSMPPTSMPASSMPQMMPMQTPVCFRAIPPSGSIRGGIDVTLLGQHMNSGLIVMFGDTPAVSCQCWSDSTMIAQLPPSSQPGPVPITFQNVPVDHSGPPTAIFTYINDGEDKLKEIALQMIGYKSTGKIEDAANVAQRILESDSGTHTDNGTDANQTEQFSMWVLNNLTKIGGQSVNVNIRNQEGQTMLHLASMLGYASVVKTLVSMGAYIDLQDVSGYTPLHFAVLCGNRNITRLLLLADADPFYRTRNGCIARDIADPTVLDLLPTDQRAWYSELNRRNSSSSIASMVQDLPAVEEVPHPPPYSQLFPDDKRMMMTAPVEAQVEAQVEEMPVQEEAETPVESGPLKEKDTPQNWWHDCKHEIANDKMLLTFWAPLSAATIVGIVCVYLMQNYGSVNTHPMATLMGDFVKRWVSLAVDTVLPMQRHSQTTNRHIRST